MSELADRCPYRFVSGIIYPDGSGPAALAYPVLCPEHGYPEDGR